MKQFIILPFLFFYLFNTSLSAQEVISVGKKVTISVNATDADIFQAKGIEVSTSVVIKDAISNGGLENMGSYKRFGKGKAELNIRDFEDRVTLVFYKSGFAPEIRTFVYDKEKKKDLLNIEVKLQTRVFQVAAEPFGSEIFINGESRGTTFPLWVFVKFNSSVSIEVKKVGYSTISENISYTDQKQPPIGLKTYSLTSRLVQLQVNPGSGSQIRVNGVLIGDGHGDVIVPENECVNVKVKKDGFSEVEKQYCNKKGVGELPLNDLVLLEDRELIVRGPEGSTISANGKNIGTKEVAIKILKGTQVDVTISKPGFISYRKTFYNKQEEVTPPSIINVEEKSSDMPEDEAFKSSSESNVANINFTLSVPSNRSEETAWKTVSSIITSYFDELEQIDRETGYLRTAWVYKTYPNVTIRTRVIVKLSNRSPLKYTIKICSEYNDESDELKRGSKDDTFFKPWTRILQNYKELINEAQARIQ